MQRFTRSLDSLTLCIVLVCAAVAHAGERDGVTEVTIQFRNASPHTRYVAHGEWVPRMCYLATPYRGGKALRYEMRNGAEFVSVDGGPMRPSWMYVRTDEQVAALTQALDQGERGFSVVGHVEDLAALAPLPTGRGLGLVVIDELPAGAGPIRKHTGVTALRARVGKDGDLKWLDHFPQLASLRLHCAAPCDPAPLASLSKLAWLRLTGKATPTSLPPMPSLRGLRLWSDVASVGFLANTPGLRSLWLHGADELTDLAPLASLPHLEMLTLRKSAATDLSPLAHLTHLVYLDINSSEQLTDIGPLAALRGLRHLSLSDCTNVEKLDALAQLTQLRQLDLSGRDRESDLSPLAALSRLERLNLSGNELLTNLRPVARLRTLQSLDLRRCPRLADLTPIRHLARGGCAVLVDKRLKPQLEEFKAHSDF